LNSYDVIKARERQSERLAAEGIFSNAAMAPGLIRRYCCTDAESQTMLERAMTSGSLRTGLQSHSESQPHDR